MADWADWDDLTDEELTARLVNRGTPPSLAQFLVARREDPDCERRIMDRLI